MISDDHLHEKKQKSRQTWIFQANPDRYEIFKSLEEGKDYWNLRQHAQEVRVGDRVLIWICGDTAGIYAVGTVMSEPMMMPDTLEGISHWTDPVEGRRPKPRVLVHYGQIMLEKPLLKKYLESVPELWNMRILQSPRATNFKVSEQEWQALRIWLETD